MKKLNLRSFGLMAAVLCIGPSSVSYAGGFVDLLVQRKLQERLQAEERTFSPAWMMGWANSPSSLISPDLNASAAGTFDQKVDPSNPADTRTFPQRYFVNSASASGVDAPVFYYICGEGACEGPDGAALAYARQYRGHVVALEHRFYGTSQPFPTLSRENLRYLRTEFALADLASFQVFAQAKWGMKGKWIAMGGSYPGSLAAYYRLKYPSLVVGALASSAPVQARANFEQYDWVVSERAGRQCATAIRNVVAKIESDMRNDPAAFEATKKIFQSQRIQDPVDFLYVVADMAAAAVQYGMKDDFCKTLITENSDPVTGYARAGLQVFSKLGMKPEDDSFQVARNEDPASYGKGVGLRQWLYQTCTEYGYFQNAYHDPSQSARSALINPDFHRRVCQELFGTPELDTSKITRGYYQPLLSPSTTQIVLTNGSNDPWAMLSIAAELGNATNPNLVPFTIQGAAHCDDLGTPSTSDSGPLKQARRLFTSLVDQWLR